MNKEQQATKDRILRITAVLEEELDLGGYLQINHHFVEGYDGDTEMTADDRATIYKTTAVTTTMWEYRETKITWYLGTACAASDERLEMVAIHEYVHALMGPLASLIPNKGNNAKLEELATESIARVIAHVRKRP